MTTPDPVRERLIGIVYQLSAYVLWGFLPLYFLSLAPTGPWEVVAARVVFSFVLCVLLIVALRAWPRFTAIVKQRRLLLWTALAGVLIYINWQVFVLATLTGHVLETSLGYFINPILTVLLGVLVLREKLRVTQWVAIGIAAIAVVVMIVGYGSFPWISLTLAASFGIYGLIKKQIGPSVDALSGLTLESFWLLPIAAVQLVLVGATTGITFGSFGVWHAVLLAFTGVATAAPLLFFAAGARRVPLTLIGLLQFITPIMQFVTGAFILGEPMPAERWIAFSIVWVALIVLSADSLRFARRGRGASDVGPLT